MTVKKLYNLKDYKEDYKMAGLGLFPIVPPTMVRDANASVTICSGGGPCKSEDRQCHESGAVNLLTRGISVQSSDITTNFIPTNALIRRDDDNDKVLEEHLSSTVTSTTTSNKRCREDDELSSSKRSCVESANDSHRTYRHIMTNKQINDIVTDQYRTGLRDYAGSFLHISRDFTVSDPMKDVAYFVSGSDKPNVTMKCSMILSTSFPSHKILETMYNVEYADVKYFLGVQYEGSNDVEVLPGESANWVTKPTSDVAGVIETPEACARRGGLEEMHLVIPEGKQLEYIRDVDNDKNHIFFYDASNGFTLNNDDPLDGEKVKGKDSFKSRLFVYGTENELRPILASFVRNKASRDDKIERICMIPISAIPDIYQYHLLNPGGRDYTRYKSIAMVRQKVKELKEREERMREIREREEYQREEKRKLNQAWNDLCTRTPVNFVPSLKDDDDAV
jgi:hypothetical protein